MARRERICISVTRWGDRRCEQDEGDASVLPHVHATPAPTRRTAFPSDHARSISVKGIPSPRGDAINRVSMPL